MASPAPMPPPPGGAPHEILGVDQRASQDDIRKKFLQEAKLWHPDKRPRDEDPEITERAKEHFVALHAAYETMSNAENYAEADAAAGGYGDLRDVFAGSTKEAWDEARANRMEAEQYLDELYEKALEGRTWTQSEREVMNATYSRTFRAVEMLRREEIRAKLEWTYSQALHEEADRHEAAEAEKRRKERELRRQRAPEPADPQPLDGPRGFSDHIEGLGEAFSELWEDAQGAASVAGSYFAAWNAVRSERWFSWGGAEKEQEGEKAEDQEEVPEVVPEMVPEVEAEIIKPQKSEISTTNLEVSSDVQDFI
eukprot:TRINITY_DN19781_c0_g2_i2.p1 TRINITY_DN19781_c0_g2~~TRINITY_DN19781_c0_g2_i2.p1  ORF type:complete len:336 (+),score=78.49 TRINITY_DN19781_c0_g2_i2:80-1009(+)